MVTCSESELSSAMTFSEIELINLDDIETWRRSFKFYNLNYIFPLFHSICSRPL